MNKKLIAAAIAVLFLTGCGREKHDDHAKEGAKKEESANAHGKEDLIKLSDEEMKRSKVRTEAIEETTLSGELTLTANVQANQDALAHVSPRAPGRIVTVYANLGTTVKAGQPLALLDSLEVGEAHSAYLQAASEAKLAAAAFERADKLYAEQVMPTKDWQRARYENEKARAQLAAANDKLRMLGVSPQGDRAVSTFPVSAPISGTVTEKHAVLGELAKTDGSLFTVVNLSTLWISANVSEKDLATVRVGAPARITVAAWPGQTFNGKVTYVGATLDKETRTIAARIEVPNADGRLKPDMFATAVLPTGSTTKALTLPESAVTLLQGLSTVFVEEGAGFEARPVELGERAGGRVTVKSGLKAGEMVVTEGVYALKARALKSQIGSGHGH
jgi:cobalt-zinc-cadmium efflux system membrane fusion protein